MSEPFVPIEDLAKHFTVSVSTVRAWVRQGHIPKDTYLKIGNTYRFNVSKVVDALSNKPDDEPQAPKPEAPVTAEAPVPVQLELAFNDPNEDM
jgi:excisionase family DNA binding protein